MEEKDILELQQILDEIEKKKKSLTFLVNKRKYFLKSPRYRKAKEFWEKISFKDRRLAISIYVENKRLRDLQQRFYDLRCKDDSFYKAEKKKLLEQLEQVSQARGVELLHPETVIEWGKYYYYYGKVVEEWIGEMYPDWNFIVNEKNSPTSYKLKDNSSLIKRKE